MRKVLLSLALSLVICFSASASEYQLKKWVIGAGGFVGSVSGDYKASGIIGQLVIGKGSGTSVTGDAYTVYNGFWVPEPDNSSIVVAENTQGKITNYPNPANNYTNFKFNLEQSAHVTLRVFDVMGNAIATVLDGYLDAGNHNVDWNLRTSLGDELASGSYMYELLVNSASANPTTSSSYSLKNVVIISK